MTFDEFSNFTMAYRSYYSQYNPFVNDYAVKLWFRALKDIPYQVITTTLDQWVLTNSKAPTIADLRGTAVEVTGEKSVDYGEAWETVCKQIRKYGYMRQDEAMEDLKQKDETIYLAAKYIGYQKLCESENVEADRANFRMIYEREADKANKERSLKEETRNEINILQELAKRKKLEGGAGNLLEFGS